MKTQKYTFSDIAALLFIIFVTIMVFKWVPHTYFQQDEWYFMGQYLLARVEPSIFIRVFSGMHFVPLEQLVLFIQYRLFWLNPVGYGIVSVLSHIAVVALLYILLRKLNLRTLYASIGALFLSLNPVSSQVVSWSPASASGAVSVMLFLAGCITWLENLSKKSIYLSISSGVLFFCAMFAKVDVIIGFLFIFIASHLFVRVKKMSYRPIIVSIMVWLIIYLAAWVFGEKDNNPTSGRTITDVARFLQLIPLWLTQIFMNHNALHLVLRKIAGPFAGFFPLVDNDRFLKMTSLIIGSAWYIYFLFIAFTKRLSIKMTVIFPVFIILAMTPYFFAITKALESRHFYIPVLFAAMWISFLLNWLEQKGLRKLNKITIVILSIFLAFFALANQPWSDYLPSHALRRQLVTQMEKITTYSPGTVVYFFKNGTSSPFQSGIGQMLLVLQAKGDNSFIPYFRSYYPYRSYFLYGTYEQGFEKLGTKGFGYYNDEKTLVKDYRKGMFEAKSVRAYEYDNKKITLRDITSQVEYDLSNTHE